MMGGHAYSKALRTHFLTFIILRENLLEHSLVELNEETKTIIKVSIHELMETNKKSIEDAQGNIGIKQLIDIVERTADNGNFPGTAKLCFMQCAPLYVQKLEELKKNGQH
ncbi:hypothetical protein AVEN_3251-1 [Araneus ventricosus]|uniref:Uncharacterized protein n=1 Tax=Araneus ventricosus TaxID=182803 RepID=A0A4Y2FNE3_ARAVE|nr:hypothetical protein AVEN_3251-1 [Araneus ventricosus]